MKYIKKYRSDIFAQNLYKNTKPKLEFDPTMTTQEFKSWKKELTNKALELMQYPDDMYKNPVVNFIFSKQRLGYRIEKYEINPEPDLWIPFLILIPDKANKNNKVPAVMCCPGSATPKESLCAEDFRDFEYDTAAGRWKFPFANAQAKHFVEQGMVAIATDNVGTGELAGSYERNNIALKLIMKGRNYVGLAVMYRQAILNWVKKQEYVDRKRIGLAGHSLGTETTMFLALFDKDVKAVIHNDFVANNNQRIISCYPPADFLYNAHWHIVPSMHEWFSFPDLLAGFAPNKLIVSEGGITEDLLKIRKAYEISGAKDNLSIYYYPDFQDEKDRKYDFKKIPENIEMLEYFKYANVNVEKHFFKADLVVPWMVKALK
ncbi:MAG: hypothetical protein KAG94_06300 [Clostridiales bacterium]|nr:hypothetical protein [Clostridiales bacterium]